METEAFSPESFNKDIEDVLRDWPCLQVQDTFPNYPDTILTITTPSSFTSSTESDSEPTLSQYSYEFAPSDYTTPSDIVTGGQADLGVYSTQDTICSDVSSHNPLPFGSLPASPPSDYTTP